MLSRRGLITTVGCGTVAGLSGCADIPLGGSDHEEVDPEEVITYADTSTSGAYHIQDGIIELELGQWTAFEFEFIGTPQVDVSIAAEKGHARLMLLPRFEWEDRYREGVEDPIPDITATADDEEPIVHTDSVSDAPYHMVVVDNTDYLGFEPDGDAIVHLSLGIPI